MDPVSTLTTAQFQKLETKELMRVLSALAMECAGRGSAAEHYQQRWGASPTASIVTRAFEWERRTRDEWLQTKAAIAPGTTTDATWAAPLVTTRAPGARPTTARAGPAYRVRWP